MNMNCLNCKHNCDHFFILRMLTFFTGFYVYIETSSPRVRGDNAKLVKGGLSFTTAKRLSFYRHMYGATIGTLKVTVGTNIIFTKSGNQGNKWVKETIDITADPGATEVRNIIIAECLCFINAS